MAISWNWKSPTYEQDQEWQRLNQVIVRLDEQGQRIEIPKQEKHK